MSERWDAMTSEERERLRQGVRGTLRLPPVQQRKQGAMKPFRQRPKQVPIYPGGLPSRRREGRLQRNQSPGPRATFVTNVASDFPLKTAACAAPSLMLVLVGFFFVV